MTSGCSAILEKDNILGVYKIGEKECRGSLTQINTCKEITLVEFVKGNFYKISDNEVAFTVWSGQSDLVYTARKFEGEYSIDSYPFTLIISNENGYLEKIVLQSPHYGIYSFGSNEENISELEIIAIGKNEIAKYIKEYPGND